MHFNNIPFLIQTLVAGVFRFLGNFISTLDPLASLINDRNKPSGIYLELSLLGSFQLWGGIRTVNFTFFCLLGIVHKKKENSTIVYSPSCRTKPVWFTFFCGTQKKKFWRWKRIRTVKHQKDKKKKAPLNIIKLV